MQVGWGIAVVVLSSLAWLGQSLSWFAPATAVRLGLTEDPDDVEPTFWADARGEALCDLLTLWTMLVAGVLLIVDSTAWPYFGLIGGGVYLYFSGRGVLTRLAMLRAGLRIGSSESVKLGLALLTVWGVMGLTTIVAAIAELEG